eukprot:3260049-Rhodomonas_salina.4
MPRCRMFISSSVATSALTGLSPSARDAASNGEGSFRATACSAKLAFEIDLADTGRRARISASSSVYRQLELGTAALSFESVRVRDLFFGAGAASETKSQD